jgi:uncharacterized protein (TIGR00730 family)
MGIFQKISNTFGRSSEAEKPKVELGLRLIHQVAIFGYADAPETGELYESVVAVSKKLAEKGYSVVDGGGPGVMRAATVGAKQAEGHVVGVTLYPKDMTHFEGKDPKNLFDEEIKCETYVERTLALMKSGQAYVIFNGGTGTISELGMAWGLARLYFGHHKPLILYGRFWEEIMNAFQKNMLLRPEELKVFKIVDTPEEVIAALDAFEEELSRGDHKHLEASKEEMSFKN